jgi:hypothetical protein
MDALWRDFTWRRADPESPVCKLRDNIPDACAEDHYLAAAIRRAVSSIRPNGKMHNHQSKVSGHLSFFKAALIWNIKSIAKAETFGQLYHTVDMLKTSGIGPMTVYDVSVRIGAYMSLKPDRIYLHAGTKLGLKALGIKPWPREVSVPMELLPPPLDRQDPDTVEDFLCTYRSAFERI